jgi:hypothetical protein
MGGPYAPHDTPHPVSFNVGRLENPASAERTWTADEVAAALEAGEHFYTSRPGTMGEGSVHAVTCRLCGRVAIRSGPDASDQNRLEHMPRCP